MTTHSIARRIGERVYYTASNVRTGTLRVIQRGEVTRITTDDEGSTYQISAQWPREFTPEELFSSAEELAAALLQAVEPEMA